MKSSKANEGNGKSERLVARTGQNTADSPLLVTPRTTCVFHFVFTLGYSFADLAAY